MKRWITVGRRGAAARSCRPACNREQLGAEANQRSRRSGRCRRATTPTPATPTLDQINKDNVDDLQVAWTFSTGVLRGHEGSPLVIGDMMYVHTPFPNTVYALDLNAGRQDRLEVRAAAGSERHRRDVLRHRLSRPRLCRRHASFLHQADTTLVALDAKTGEVKWSVKNGDPAKGETNTATVLPVKDKVIVGISGGEFGVRGSRDRLQHRRRHRWPGAPIRPGRTTRCWSIRRRPPRSASRSARTARSTAGKATSGRSAAAPPGAGTATIRSSNLIYYGTGNPSTWNPAQRPGDNKYSMTIFARDPDTGMAKWLYQMTPARRVGLRRRQRDDPVRRPGRRRRSASCCSTRTATASPTRSTARPASCSSPRSTTRR